VVHGCEKQSSTDMATSDVDVFLHELSQLIQNFFVNSMQKDSTNSNEFV